MMILQEKHIPFNMSKPQTFMPWINGNLKKKINRNNRLFKSRKKSQKHRSNFLKKRQDLQKQMRQKMGPHQWYNYHHSRRRQGTERILKICKTVQEGQHWHRSLKKGQKKCNKSTAEE